MQAKDTSAASSQGFSLRRAILAERRSQTGKESRDEERATVPGESP
jgi:hypothetical protein